MTERASRLVPIDLARDRDALRGKYRGRPSTLILGGVVGVRIDDGTRPHSRVEVYGRVVQVHPQSLIVPAHLRAVFNDLPAPPPNTRRPAPGWRVLPHPPRYDVTLAVGPALRPWIVAARRLGR